MIEYYSKIEPNKLLHVVVRKEDLKPGRKDIIPEEHFIQCSHLNMEKGKTFRPHKCIFYDLDDTILVEPILNPGDASFTLEGGHNYEILEDNTLVYEYKTGPYEGQALDKTFIGE